MNSRKNKGGVQYEEAGHGSVCLLPSVCLIHSGRKKNTIGKESSYEEVGPSAGFLLSPVCLIHFGCMKNTIGKENSHEEVGSSAGFLLSSVCLIARMPNRQKGKRIWSSIQGRQHLEECCLPFCQQSDASVNCSLLHVKNKRKNSRGILAHFSLKVL